jgi:hypothetical protein
MFGKRLLIGVVVMGIGVPSILFFALQLQSFSQVFTIAATCLLAWGVADLAADILARPRLKGRTPTGALRELDMERPKKS